MIKTGVKTYHYKRVSARPTLRRSSRNPGRESNFQEIENVKIYYGVRTSDIKSVFDITNKYKKIKRISKTIQKLFISKYGTNFGSILSKEIMQDYLAVCDNTTEWYSVWYTPSSDSVKPGFEFMQKWQPHEVIKKANLMGITDPRTNTYNAMQLTPYLKEDYTIISSGTDWHLLAKTNLPYRWQGADDTNSEQSDDEVEIPTFTANV
jgi:hypothetical protein